MFKVNNRDTRTRCEICSKLTIKTPERRHWRRSDVFILNFLHNRQSLHKTIHHHKYSFTESGPDLMLYQLEQ